MMARPLAAVVGVASVLPLVYLVYFIWHVTSLEHTGLTRFEALLSLHLAMICLVVILLMAVYLFMLYRSAAVPENRRTLWAVVLFMANVFAFPVFWYLFLWKRTDSNP